MRIKKTHILYINIYVMLVCLFILMPHTVLLNKVLAVLTMICSVVWMYKCWHNMYMLIISTFIAYSNYSIAMGIYIDETLRPKYLYPQISNVDTYSIGIFLLFLTMLSLVILSDKYKKTNINIAKVFIHRKNKNNIMFAILTIVFLLIIVFGYSREENSRGNSTAIYEYASILLILMFYYAGGGKIQKVLCMICSGIYSLTSILNGTRIEALICITIFVLCYFENEVNPAILLSSIILGVFLFSIVGTIRGNWGILKEDGVEVFNILLKNKFVFDTCTHAYFPMLCMVELYKNYSILDAVHFLGAFVLTVLIGQSRVPDGNLIQVVGKIFYHNYGGVSVGFFFVWFSYLGALIYSYVILFYTKFLSNITVNLSPVKSSMVIYVIASVPRWYLYGPWSLFRGVIICALITKLILLSEKFIRK